MKKVTVYYITTILVLFVVSAYRPLMSLYAKDLGASMVQIGLLSTSFSILPLFIALSLGVMIDRIGPKKPILLAALGITLSMTVLCVFPTLSALYVSQVVMGISQFVMFVALQNGICQSASSEHEMERFISRFSLFSSLGMLMGPVFGGYMTDHLGYKTTFLLLACMAILTFMTAWLVKYKVKLTSSEPFSIRQVVIKQTYQGWLMLKIPNLGRAVLVSTFILVSLDLFNVYFPLFAQSIGLNASQIGWLLSAQAAASFFIRLIVPWLVVQYGRRLILWLSMLVAAVSYGIITVIHPFHWLCLICILLGFGFGVSQPLTITLTYNAAPAGRTGEALAIRLVGGRLGQVVIPLTLAAMSQVLGLGMIFIVQSCMLLVGVWLAKHSPELKGDNSG